MTLPNTPYPDPPASPLAKVGSFLKNVFTSISNSNWGPDTSAPQVPQFYHQVTKKDTSLNSVANQYNLPVQQLVDNNNGAKSLPPVGSYIQLQPPPDSTLNQQAQGLSHYLGAGNDLNLAPYQGQGRGDPAAQNLRNQANLITQQLSTGQLPDNIPSAVVGFLQDKKGNTVTLQDLYAEGYVMNDKGVLVKQGNGSQAGNNDFKNTATYKNVLANTPFLDQKRWDPQRHKFVSIGQLLKEGKLDLQGTWYRRGQKGSIYRHRLNSGKKSNIPQTTGPRTREAPNTVLDLHLGSG